MTIYIDQNFKCHADKIDECIEIETNFFDGKCASYIDGYMFIPEGAEFVTGDGVKIMGEAVFPWKDWRELDTAQREYEREQYAAMAAELADARAALEILGVSADE